MYREKRCLFCGGDDGESLTAEHLWSDWMTPLLMSVRPKRSRKHEPAFTLVNRGEGPAEKRQIVRRSHRLDEKAKCLCHSCNNERLGRIESDFFKPLVEPMMVAGINCVLTVEDRLTIAAWAFKTLVIHNHAYNKPPFLYSAGDRKRFIHTLLPPEKNFRLWLARFNVAGRPGHMTGIPLAPKANASREYKRFWCYTFTFSVGQLMLQAHAIKPTSGRRADITGMFPEMPQFQRKVVQVWPVWDHREVLWPPPEDLLNAELDQFCCRFGGRFSDHLRDIRPLGAQTA